MKVDLTTSQVSALGEARTTMSTDVRYGTADATSLRVTHRGPRLQAQPTQTTAVLQELRFTLRAHDDEFGPLSFAATGLPRFARFDAETATFTWRPRPDQEGTWIVTFTATDGDGLSDSARVRIEVRSTRQQLECALLASCGGADPPPADVPPRAGGTSADAGRAEA